MNIALSMLLALLLALPAMALQPQPRQHPIPPELGIEELRITYGQLFAEEVSVRYRAPQAADRVETYIIRVDPGPEPARRPARVFLELGQLRILFSDNQMLAINVADPEHYLRVPYEGPITPQLVARLLPPLPLPHLALAAADNDWLRALTPYTPDITWQHAILDAETRPATMRITGSGMRGQAVLLANADTLQLMRISLQIRSVATSGDGNQPRAGLGDAAMEITTRAIDPGDPAAWTIETAGRQRVRFLTELRPDARPKPLERGARVPDLRFTRADNTAWTLSSALRASERLAPPGQAPAPVALILVRIPAELAEADERFAAAAIALRTLRAPDTGIPMMSDIAAAGIMALTDFTHNRVDAARAKWTNQTAPLRDELLIGHAPSQTIDLFDPDAGAVLILVAGDHTLFRSIRLDTITRDELTEQLRPEPALPEAPAPEPEVPSGRDDAGPG